MINLIYIRAAIRQATGKTLPLDEIVTLLVEEGLITKAQSQDESLVFRGYAEFFETDDASTKIETIDNFPHKKSVKDDDGS
tara:strand:- start:190 stop:432 length:243 start_codon:yes stop_codon:yes gene_type:complete